MKPKLLSFFFYPFFALFSEYNEYYSDEGFATCRGAKTQSVNMLTRKKKDLQNRVFLPCRSGSR